MIIDDLFQLFSSRKWLTSSFNQPRAPSRMIKFGGGNLLKFDIIWILKSDLKNIHEH